MRRKGFIQSMCTVLLVLTIMLLPTTALAAGKNPLEKVDGVGNNQNVNPDQVYDDLNSILELIYYGAGIITVGATIFAAILLSTAAGNPQRRNNGLIALAMALIGGWVLYKSYGLQQWAQKFGSS